MAFKRTVDIESILDLIAEFSATSAIILDVTNSIIDNVKSIQLDICESFTAEEADMLKYLEFLAVKAVEYGSSWKRTDRIIQEVCCDMREMCRAFEEYETADPGLANHLF